MEISSDSLDRVCLAKRVQCTHTPDQSRIAQATAAAAAAALALHTALVVLGVQVEWRLPPAARAALALPRAAFPSFIFNRATAHLRHTDRTQNHPYWLLPVPFSPSQVDPGRASRLPAAIAALQARPICLSTCPAYLVWSSFVRTSPASRKPTKPDSNSTFAAVVSCL